MTPLLLVCNEGDKLYGSAELLLENGANPNGSIRVCVFKLRVIIVQCIKLYSLVRRPILVH